MKIRDARKSDWFWAENGIVDREDLGIYEKMGYIALCRHANRANRCYPSIPTVGVIIFYEIESAFYAH